MSIYRVSLCVLGAAAGAVGMADAAAPLWQTDVGSSQVGFVATQAGVDFDGQFKKYNATVQFDPKDLAGSRIEVTIDMASVVTGEPDRDHTITGPEMFWVARYPQAQYVATSFRQTGAGHFTGSGKLTLRGTTADVPIDFEFKGVGNAVVLEGTAQLKRLDFGVGKGEWSNTEWVSDPVRVTFHLKLTK